MRDDFFVVLRNRNFKIKERAMFNNYYPYPNPMQGFQPTTIPGMSPYFYNPAQYQSQPVSAASAQTQNGQAQFQQGPVSTNKLFANGIEDVKTAYYPTTVIISFSITIRTLCTGA